MVVLTEHSCITCILTSDVTEVSKYSLRILTTLLCATLCFLSACFSNGTSDGNSPGKKDKTSLTNLVLVSLCISEDQLRSAKQPRCTTSRSLFIAITVNCVYSELEYIEISVKTDTFSYHYHFFVIFVYFVQPRMVIAKSFFSIFPRCLF